MGEASRQAIILAPDDPDIYFNLGSYYEDQGKFDLAISQYEQAITVSPNNAGRAKNNLSRIKILRSEFDEALSIASEAIEHESNSFVLATLWKNKGWALLELGREKEAKTSLMKSLAYDNLGVSTNCLLGQLDNKRQFWSVCINQISYLPEVKQWRTDFLNNVIKD